MANNYNNLWQKARYGAHRQYQDVNMNERNETEEQRRHRHILAHEEFAATYVPQNNIDMNVNIISAFTDSLSITNDGVIDGRGVVTNEDITLDEQVIRATSFAIAEKYNPAMEYCFTCYHVDEANEPRRLFPCQCRHVRFCSEICRNGSSHYLECNTFFQYIGRANGYDAELRIKLAVQMVLTAVACFDSVDELQAFVETIVDTNPNTFRDLIPAAVNSSRTQLECIMRLKIPEMSEDICRNADVAYSYVIALPKIRRMCSKKGQQRFMKHLVRNMLATVDGHGHYLLDLRSVCQRIEVYDSMSFVNHSCVPNIRVINTFGRAECYATHLILQGSEITRNYCYPVAELERGIDGASRLVYRSRIDRQNEIRNTFQFQCSCQLCLFDDPNQDQIRRSADKPFEVLNHIVNENQPTPPTLEYLLDVIMYHLKTDMGGQNFGAFNIHIR